MIYNNKIIYDVGDIYTQGSIDAASFRQSRGMRDKLGENWAGARLLDAILNTMLNTGDCEHSIAEVCKIEITFYRVRRDITTVYGQGADKQAAPHQQESSMSAYLHIDGDGADDTN